MAVFTALTDDYGHAKKLLSLLKTEGIDASITGGDARSVLKEWE